MSRKRAGLAARRLDDRVAVVVVVSRLSLEFAGEFPGVVPASGAEVWAVVVSGAAPRDGRDVPAADDNVVGGGEGERIMTGRRCCLVR